VTGKVIPLVLGTANFGAYYGATNTVLNATAALELLRVAHDLGLREVDTAPVYGEGLAEEFIGKADFGFQYRVVTKLPRFSATGLGIRNLVRESLFRLNREYVDLIIHNEDDLLAHGDLILSQIEALKAEGLVHRFGVSTYYPDKLSLIMRRYKLDIIQIPSNPIDLRYVNHEVCPLIEASDAELYVRSVFLQGTLLDRSVATQVFGPTWVKKLDSWFDGGSRQQLIDRCFSFQKHHWPSARYVVGANDCCQLVELVESFKQSAQEFSSPLFSDLPAWMVIPSSWGLRR
jgi:aryl-alcohol dehydrogenase-like predicted oxidoreductase